MVTCEWLGKHESRLYCDGTLKHVGSLYKSNNALWLVLKMIFQWNKCGTFSFLMKCPLVNVTQAIILITQPSYKKPVLHKTNQNSTKPGSGYPDRQLSGSPWPFGVNLSRILLNQVALKLPVIGSSTVQCYGFQNIKSGVVVWQRRRYIL